MKEKQADSSDSLTGKIPFFGRIMANVSHEFNNIITVIGELAGLLKDLTVMASRGREIPPEKIAGISESISKQVQRGKNLVTHMNRFSHSADEPYAKIDLVQTFENMQVLTDRLFKNRRTAVSFEPPAENFSIFTNPFELRHIIFSCLDRFLNASCPEVSVSLQRANGNEIELYLSGRLEAENSLFFSGFEALQAYAAGIEGRLIYGMDCDEIIIRLILPAEGEAPDRA